MLEANPDRRLLAVALAVTVALPSAYYLAGSPMTSKYTSAIREFPYAMVLGDTLRVLEEMNRTAWLVASLNHTPIVADPSPARFIHLYLRNPTPQQLTWLNTATLTCASLRKPPNRGNHKGPPPGLLQHHNSAPKPQRHLQSLPHHPIEKHIFFQ
ncbi:hypothetical protein [Infirmifilum sp. SLHALR2]|nr:MAG: hypothetical protein B7L53_09205 [Thermofilum sp. NZ13]